MSDLILLVVLSAVTYRISRFIVLDSLIDGPRDRIADWLERHSDPRPWNPHVVFRKVGELLECPWCITIWVAGAVVATHHHVVDPLPVPVWMWLTTATGALIFWAIIDTD